MQKDKQINAFSIIQMKILIESIIEWGKSPDKPFLTCWNNSISNSKYIDYENAETKEGWIVDNGIDLLESISHHLSGITILQAFNYFYDRINNNYKQFEGVDQQNFAELKRKFVQGNLNNDQILKVIRHSMSHNDDENTPNYKIDLSSGTFRFCLNNAKESIDIEDKDILNLMTYYLSNIIEDRNNSFSVCYDYVNILNKTNADISDKIILYNKSGQKYQPDSYQKSALEKTVSRLEKGEFCYYPIMPYYPLKNNSVTNIMNSMGANILINLLNVEKFSNIREMFSLPIIRHNIILGSCIKVLDLLSLLYSNLLFIIFSSTNIDNVKKSAENIGLNVDIRRIRNAIIHGTFFYDNDKSYYFYDDRVKCEDTLQYIGTLSFQEISKLASSVSAFKIKDIDNKQEFVLREFGFGEFN